MRKITFLINDDNRAIVVRNPDMSERDLQVAIMAVSELTMQLSSMVTNDLVQERKDNASEVYESVFGRKPKEGMMGLGLGALGAGMGAGRFVAANSSNKEGDDTKPEVESEEPTDEEK